MKTFLSYSITCTGKFIGRLLLLFAACTGGIQSQSQQAKSPVQLGDQYFAMGEYYTAALLYGQYLNPPKNQYSPTGFPINSKRKRVAATGSSSSRADILFKQAESYRLANYWQEAANAYKECTEKNPGEYRAAKYWYAVCERSLAHYDTAEQSIKEYISTAPENDKYTADAEKELQTMEYIRQQLSRPDSVLIKTKKLDAANGKERGVYAPAYIGGNQFIISSTQPDSVQTQGINPNHSRLFYATITNAGITEMSALPISASDPAMNQGAAAISTDGKYLYISQWKKEKGKTVSSIYYSTKEENEWTAPKLLASVNQKEFNSKQPFISADGKYLYFASDRPGGAGGFDIWYAPIKSDGSTGEPINAGTNVNTAADEVAPFYHSSSNTLVFSSNRKPGMGGYDLFAAKGNESNWKTAENLGHPLSSARDDIYFFAEEKKPLLSDAIFSSDRGNGCCLETYRFIKSPKAKRFSGIIRDCSDNAPLANTEVIMKDKSGNSWKAVTGDDGKYLFDLGTGVSSDLDLTITKALYKIKTVTSKIDKTDESDLLIDKLTNEDLCLEKKPEEKLVIKAENVVTLYFDFDKSDLKPVAVDKLDSIYNVMVEYPASTIQISGYTDGRGTVEYNNKLSDRRARACAEYLVKKGIEAARITFVSFGACCPVEMELINGRDNAEGRSKNRRALINIKKD